MVLHSAQEAWLHSLGWGVNKFEAQEYTFPGKQKVRDFAELKLALFYIF